MHTLEAYIQKEVSAYTNTGNYKTYMRQTNV